MLFFRFYFFLFLFIIFSNKSKAQTSTEFFLRLRNSLSIKKENLFNRPLTQGQFYFKSSYYPSIDIEAQIQLIASNPYKTTHFIKDFIKLYPSLKWLIHENLDLSFGRIFYENQFPQILSINKYENFFYVFDGMLLDYSTDLLNVKLWGASLPKKTVRIDFKYGSGFFLNLKSLSNFIDYLNIHAVYFSKSFGFFNQNSQNHSRYGIGLKGMFKFLNLSYDFIFIGHGKGIKFTLKNQMYHILLNYYNSQLLDGLFSLGYHRDSSGYKPWYYDRHNMAGLLDIFLWGNLNYFFIKWKNSPYELFDFQISFYNFYSTEEGKIYKGFYGSFFKPNTKSFSVEKRQKLGQELNITIKKDVTNQLELDLLIGWMFPTYFLKKKLFSRSIYNQIQLTGLYKF